MTGGSTNRSTEALVWTPVDVATLPKAMQTMYANYKELARSAAAAREAFNSTFKEFIRNSGQVEIADEQSLVIGHNFGKLSFAISDKPEKERRSARQAMSFGAPASVGSPKPHSRKGSTRR